ncbi:hypothetical protein HanRHA438_Chr02g0046941 [Helianthus annuus]|uniref:Uncharacterized protein n=1 Tax=Helianthus annuus TaxID=4232 RepID=A0A9K3JLX0_HELAN|nr:hypothetical protein HanXRQr2_Chr02g0045951 [Helianthus annuus]KAJ0938181.1 hypothetical protein HanRHA438_Chr02g0046941 [Helianthus annuus]KAJ0950216.1 hypothetical protein HanPSC8_Chr02g0045591 [Helianthus annuus]
MIPPHIATGKAWCKTLLIRVEPELQRTTGMSDQSYYYWCRNDWNE